MKCLELLYRARGVEKRIKELVRVKYLPSTPYEEECLDHFS